MNIIRGFLQKRIKVYIVLMVLVGLSVATGCAKKSIPLGSPQVRATGAESAVAQSQTDADSQAAGRSGVTEETLTEGETASPFAGSGKTIPSSGSQSGLDDFAPAKDGLRIASMLPFQATSELDDVHFQFDHHDMDRASQVILQKNAVWLKQHPGVKLEIQGHADERGTNNYNLGLGERRAQSVKKYLTALGISEDRLFAVSYGEEKPFCSENNENCWWQNRRGHFLVSGPQASRGEVLGMLP